jgi:hypothetical protein
MGRKPDLTPEQVEEIRLPQTSPSRRMKARPTATAGVPGSANSNSAAKSAPGGRPKRRSRIC